MELLGMENYVLETVQLNNQFSSRTILMNQEHKNNHIQNYYACPECQFWITRMDKFCPNCGTNYIKNPYGNGMIWGSLLGITIWVYTLHVWFSAITALIGVAIFQLIGNVISGRIFSKEVPHLIHDEKNIRQQINHIAEQKQQIKKQEEYLLKYKQEIIEEGNSEKLQETIISIDKAILILQSQEDILYEQKKLGDVKFWGIEQERWLNKIKPLIANWEKIVTPQECEKRIQSFKGIMSNGKDIVLKWQNQEILASTSEGQSYIQNIENSVEACQQLIDELLVRKTQSVIEGIKLDTSPTSHALSEKAIEQLYDIISFADVQKNEISKIEQKMQEDLNNLENEQKIAKIHYE